jgi:hypothetical protein
MRIGRGRIEVSIDAVPSRNRPFHAVINGHATERDVVILWTSAIVEAERGIACNRS